MAKHKIIIISFICFSMALASQRSSQKPLKLPPRKPGMTSEEYKKEIEKAIEQHRKERIAMAKEYMNLLARQAWLRLLQISERQWIRIEPKYRKANDLDWETWTGAGTGGSNMESFHWNRPSDNPYHSMAGKARDQMSEGYRIVEELIDLLEDENSTDEQIRKKIDALQQVRDKDRKALSEAKKELAEVLTTPRQEAIFLIMGYVD